MWHDHRIHLKMMAVPQGSEVADTWTILFHSITLHFCSRLDATSPRPPLCMCTLIPMWLTQAALVGRPVALKAASFPTPELQIRSSWLTGISPMPIRPTWKTSEWEIMQRVPAKKHWSYILVCLLCQYTWQQRASRGQSLFVIVLELCLQFASPLWWPKVRNKSWSSMVKF